MKRYYINILLFTLFASITLQAQDLKKDFEIIQQKYLNLENFNAGISVLIYDLDKSQTKPSLIKKGAIKIAGNKIWYQMDETTFVRSNSEALMINSEYKMAVYGSTKGKKGKSNKELILPDLDKAFENYKKVEYKGIVGTDKHYSITFVEQSPYKRVELYVNKDLMLIHKMSYTSYDATFNQNLKVEMSFNNLSVAPITDNSVFLMKSYIKKQGGTWKGINSLTGYDIIDSEKTSQDFR